MARSRPDFTWTAALFNGLQCPIATNAVISDGRDGWIATGGSSGEWSFVQDVWHWSDG